MAQQAKDSGLIDGLAFDDEVDSALAQLLGRRTRLQRDDRVAPAPARFAPQPSIALVYVEGDMIDGRTTRAPLIGSQVSGSYTIAEAIAAARESPLIKAVVLRVEPRPLDWSALAALLPVVRRDRGGWEEPAGLPRRLARFRAVEGASTNN